MTVSRQTLRELERWYPLKPHPVQIALINAVDDGIRFPVVAAGRRSGKTERAKRHLVRKALEVPGNYFACAPTHEQAYRIYWEDLLLLTCSSTHKRKPNIAERKIYLNNGSTISVFGLDKPQRMEGALWHGGNIDEIADVKASAIEANIMPALDTVVPGRENYRAWCWWVGVPEGRNHYYDMYNRAASGLYDDWAAYTWLSEEILPPDVIARAKASMSPRMYQQEYCAAWLSAGGAIYPNYSKANITDASIDGMEPLHWTHDQNYVPMSSAIFVHRENLPHLLDEIVLEHAAAIDVAKEFLDKFSNHQNKVVYMYGDPAGKAGEKHGKRSYYLDIEKELTRHGWHVIRRIKSAHPAIRDRQSSVNWLIQDAVGHSRLFVNPKKAPWSHKGLQTVEFLPGSQYLEDERNQYQHITTAIGYYADWHWPSRSGKIIDRADGGY